MQLFVQQIDGRTVVLDAESDDKVEDVRNRIAGVEGVLEEDLRLLYAGKQLNDTRVLSEYRIGDGATIFSALRLRGGAAARAKLAAEIKAHKEAQAREYGDWFKLADKTEETGIMRVLCVSMVVETDKFEVHGEEDDWGKKTGSAFASEPNHSFYDVPDPDDANNMLGTGFEHQADYDTCFAGIVDTFCKHWSVMKPAKGIVSDTLSKTYYTYNIELYVDENGERPKSQGQAGKNGEKEKPGEELEGEMMNSVALICASGHEGLWFQGPVRIEGPDIVIWDFAQACELEGIWNDKLKCTKDPWRIAGTYANLERWMFQGVGTSTFYVPDGSKKLKLWSQDDLTGELGLTDG